MQCTKCQLDKEAEDFYENLRHVSGLTGICKSCTYNRSSDKDKISKPIMTLQEAAEAFEKLDVHSDTYFKDKAVLIGIMSSYNNEPPDKSYEIKKGVWRFCRSCRQEFKIGESHKCCGIWI